MKLKAQNSSWPLEVSKNKIESPVQSLQAISRLQKMKGGNYCMVKTTSTIIRNEGKLLNIILIFFEELGGWSLDIDKFAVLSEIHLFELCKSGCVDIDEIVG